MSLFRSLGKIFSGPPYEVQMLLSDEAVVLSVQRGSTPIKHADVISQKGLPDSLSSFLRQQIPSEDGRYYLPFPVARHLSRELASHISDTFKLETSNIDRLQEITTPEDFRVAWQYDTKQQCLIRRLHNAEGHLGQGWFFKGKNVWQVNPVPSDNLLRWLQKPVITSKNIVRFRTEVFPEIQSKLYSCELSVADDFDVSVTIVKMLYPFRG